MRRNVRQEEIDRLRGQQAGASRGPFFDPHADRFDRDFDAMERRFDTAMKRPGLSVLAFWILALIGNLLFWAALIFVTLWILGQFGVI